MERDWTGNYNSIYKTLGASSHTDEEREANDYYATDPVAIDKLLTVEKPFPMIWECACGEGHLSKRLKKHGYIVVSTDLIDRGYSTAGVDFLKQRSLPPPTHYLRHINQPTLQVRQRIRTQSVRVG